MTQLRNSLRRRWLNLCWWCRVRILWRDWRSEMVWLAPINDDDRGWADKEARRLFGDPQDREG